jgi:hypothetical protein
MLRLHESLVTFKKKQAECFISLPKPMLYKEEPEYAACHSLDDILACRRKADIDDDDAGNTSNVSILRSAIEELARSKESTEGISTGDLFDYLEVKLPWLKGEQGAECEVRTLSAFNVINLHGHIERPLANAQRMPSIHFHLTTILLFVIYP